MTNIYKIIFLYCLSAWNSTEAQNTFFKTFSRSDNQTQVGWSIIQTSDGGYAMAGPSTDTSGYADFYLIKINAGGDTLFTRTYGGAYDDVPENIIQTNDGGYLLSGYSNSFTNYPDSTKCYLIKTNSNGDTLWSKIYGGIRNEGFAVSLQKNSGGYISIGITTSFGTGNEFATQI
jgi:hypothetical protein